LRHAHPRTEPEDAGSCRSSAGRGGVRSDRRFGWSRPASTGSGWRRSTVRTPERDCDGRPSHKLFYALVLKGLLRVCYCLVRAAGCGRTPGRCGRPTSQGGTDRSKGVEVYELQHAGQVCRRAAGAARLRPAAEGVVAVRAPVVTPGDDASPRPFCPVPARPGAAPLCCLPRLPSPILSDARPSGCTCRDAGRRTPARRSA